MCLGILLRFSLYIAVNNFWYIFLISYYDIWCLMFSLFRESLFSFTLFFLVIILTVCPQSDFFNCSMLHECINSLLLWTFSKNMNHPIFFSDLFYYFHRFVQYDYRKSFLFDVILLFYIYIWNIFCITHVNEKLT